VSEMKLEILKRVGKISCCLPPVIY